MRRLILGALVVASCAPARPSEAPSELDTTGTLSIAACQPDLAARILDISRSSVIVLACEEGYDPVVRRGTGAGSPTRCSLGPRRPALASVRSLWGGATASSALQYNAPYPAHTLLHGACTGASHFVQSIITGRVRFVHATHFPGPPGGSPPYGDEILRTGDAAHCELPGCAFPLSARIAPLR